MSEVNNKLLQRATYMRNLLIAHVTGRQVNESDYHKLRHYFMGQSDTSQSVPAIVVEHADLASLWQSLKYSCGSVEDRKNFIVDQFSDFLVGLSDHSLPESGSRPHQVFTEALLQESWTKAIITLELKPEVAVEQMRLMVEQLCYQLLRYVKVVPDPMQHNLKALVSLPERSLMISAGKKYFHVIKGLVMGCEETLNAIENFRADRTHIMGGKIDSADRDPSSVKVLISLYGCLASMLLSAWRVREMLLEGESSL